MQTCDGGIKKQKRNDYYCRPFSGKPGHHREDPQKTRHDSDVQTSNGEKMNRSSLLKRFFDVFRRLMAQPENNAAQEILHLRRIVESATNRALHPGPRLLRCSENRISSAAFQQDAVFGIADKQTSPHILTREI